MATWDNEEKPLSFSGGIMFNELGITFNQYLDPDTNNIVYFNGIGLESVWTNQTPKPATTYSKPSKVASSWTNQVKI